MPSRTSVTLVELIAALAVLALVLAIVGPSLAGVRTRGKETVCLNNLGRISQANVIYSARDNTDPALPFPLQHNVPIAYGGQRSRMGRYLWGGKSGRGLADGSPFFWGTAFLKGPATRPLNRILYGDVFPNYQANPGAGLANWRADEELDLPLFRCPADNGHTGLHYADFRDSGLSSYDFFGTSYVANLLWVAAPGLPLVNNSPFMHGMADISNPSRTIQFLENNGTFAGQVEVACGGDPTLHVGGWHGVSWLFNAGFADGHAAPVHIRGSRNEDIEHWPVGDFNFWGCAMVRGDGWQLDTLPANPVAIDAFEGGRAGGATPEHGSPPRILGPEDGG